MAAASPYQYDIYGLNLLSDIRLSLPGAADLDPDTTTIMLSTRKTDDEYVLGPGLQLNPDHWPQHINLSDGQLYMRWATWFDFLVSADGSRVSCRNLSDRALVFLEAYLTNLAVSAALIQKGEEPLHSTAVDFAGHCIGLLGESGAGKSTLAAFLCSRGGKLVTDDILRIRFEVGVSIAQPGPCRLKLREEAAKRLVPNARRSGIWSLVGGKYIYDMGDQAERRPKRRLKALYHLCPPEDPNDTKIAIERLSGQPLFHLLAGSTMHNDIILPARLKQHFVFVHRLAQSVPVYRISYPRSFAALDDVAEMLAGSLRDESVCG
jgi:hypothetical protein